MSFPLVTGTVLLEFYRSRQRVTRTLRNVQERGPDKVLNTLSLDGIRDSLALSDFTCGIHLLEEAGN